MAGILRALVPLMLWLMRALVVRVARHHGAAFAPWVRDVSALAAKIGCAAVELERACHAADPDTPSAIDAMGLRAELNRAVEYALEDADGR